MPAGPPGSARNRPAKSSSSRRDGGGGGGPGPRAVQVSKKLSWLLRHGAEKEGLQLAAGGWVNLGDALQTSALRGLRLSVAEVKAVVRENEKQRFALRHIEGGDGDGDGDDDDAAHFLIRANQGHSLAAAPEDSTTTAAAGDAADAPPPLLRPVAPGDADVPRWVVHGTSARAWEEIRRSGGLRRMGRLHVHFAAGLPAGFEPVEPLGGEGEADGERGGEGEGERERPPVISGMRNSATVLVYLDVRRALEAGLPLWRSANGVVLSEGMAWEGVQGEVVPLELVMRVEVRGGRGGGKAGGKARNGEGGGGGRIVWRDGKPV